MASITWDGNTLENVWAGTPASRLNAFEPAVRVVGQRRTLLGSGAPRVWAYRTDYLATFEIRDIANSDLALCVALAEHLQNEGVVTVTPDDTLAVSYANCVLAPGADAPTPKLTDPQALRYSMQFTLLNLDGTPLLAVY
jgi:hypothetical protein